MTEWIPASERVPKDKEIVIIARDYHIVPVCCGYVREGRWYVANNVSEDAWTRENNVTHWMPMPEPPMLT